MILKEKSISRLTITEYFSGGIAREANELAPPLSDGVIQYLTHVLIHFSESRHLFNTANNHCALPTLALLYESAHKAPTRHQRNTTLRQLGDSALFMGALFYEYFAKKGINKDYFIGMGGAAYSSLGDCNYGDSAVYYELAEKFPALLQVLANVCAVDLHYNADDIFSLLERWQGSKDDTLRKQLHAIGIIPSEFNQQH